MTAGNWIMFGNAELRMRNGSIQWGSDAFRVALLKSSYTPDVAHSAWSNMSANQVANGSGYVTHGKSISVSEFRAGQEITLDCNDQNWTSASFSAKYAVIVHDANGDGALASTDVPIMYCNLDIAGGSLTPVAGTLSLIMNPGLYTYTLASS